MDRVLYLIRLLFHRAARVVLQRLVLWRTWAHWELVLLQSARYFTAMGHRGMEAPTSAQPVQPFLIPL
jgi:hypothetical protein